MRVVKIQKEMMHQRYAPQLKKKKKDENKEQTSFSEMLELEISNEARRLLDKEKR